MSKDSQPEVTIVGNPTLDPKPKTVRRGGLNVWRSFISSIFGASKRLAQLTMGMAEASYNGGNNSHSRGRRHPVRHTWSFCSSINCGAGFGVFKSRQTGERRLLKIKSEGLSAGARRHFGL